MSGNVWEWVWDGMGYESDSQTDPTGLRKCPNAFCEWKLATLEANEVSIRYYIALMWQSKLGVRLVRFAR